jgi:Kef-type K+ transport system membrane component KefB
LLEWLTRGFDTAHGNTQVLLAIGLTLVVSALAGRLAKKVKLPAVTGYIAVGILIGPYGLAILSHEMLADNLRVFADIALTIIAFSIGKMLDFRFTKIDYKRPVIIPSTEAFGAFVLVTVGTLLIVQLPISRLVPEGEGFFSFMLPLALLLGAISMSTAPASTLAVVKEHKGNTMLSRCLMMSVVVDNALAIGVFGIVALLVRDVFIAGSAGGVLSGVLIASGRILGALLWGALVAILVHPLIERQKEHGHLLMLTLGTLLLCAGVAEILSLPSMLAGIALGVVITNSYRCERGAFEAIEKFEPPLFAMFFVIAGTHFDFAAFVGSAAAVGVYIIARIAGKYIGVMIATRALRVEDCLQHFLGLCLVPQSAIAMSLVFLVQSNADLQPFATPITTVVLTAVALSEIIGPPLTGWALRRSHEHEIAEAHKSALEHSYPDVIEIERDDV